MNNIRIPKNATNGDMIRTVFPNAIITHVYEVASGIEAVNVNFYGSGKSFSLLASDWWNAPYQHHIRKGEIQL